MSANRIVQIKWKNNFGTYRRYCKYIKAKKLALEFEAKGWFYEIDELPFK